MAAKSENHLGSLYEIRDHALILSIGNAYVCEEPILMKIGGRIGLLIDKLEDEIELLKKRFPGQMMEDVDTQGDLERIRETAVRLREPDSEITEQCTVGELGKYLEDQVDDLAGAVRRLVKKIEGESESYGGKDFVSRFFTGIKHSVAVLVSLFVKVTVILIVIALIPMGYLFLTMETEGSLNKALSKDRAHIQAQKDVIAEQEFERKQLEDKIRELEDQRLQRLQEVDLIELNMKLHKLIEEISGVRAEIDLYEKKMEEKKTRLEALKKKSFWKRLFRL
jgi:hypothetical protein